MRSLESDDQIPRFQFPDKQIAARDGGQAGSSGRKRIEEKTENIVLEIVGKRVEFSKNGKNVKVR